MKTGKEIYEEIKKVTEDRKEMGEACDMVSNELGQSSMAYKFLDDAHKFQTKALDKLLNTRYEEQPLLKPKHRPGNPFVQEHNSDNVF